MSRPAAHFSQRQTSFKDTLSPTYTNHNSYKTMPFNWTDTAEKQLLIRILHLAAPKLPSFDEVAAGMPDGVTAEACKHRMRKIKKEIEAGGGSSAVKTPPTKRGAGKTLSSTNKRKVKNVTGSDDSDPAGRADDDDDEESPLKKVKYQSVKRESKPEEDDDNEWLV